MRGSKVVLDTNIWISCFLRGDFVTLLDLVDVHRIKLFTCPELVEELSDVLQRDHIRAKLMFPTNRYVRFHRNLCILTRDAKKRQYVLPDIDDVYLVDLALQNKCRFLVTGDGPLLGVGRIRNLRFVSWRYFRDQLEMP